MTDEDTTTVRGRAEELLDYIAARHGLRYFGNALLGHADPGRWETDLPETKRNWLEHILEHRPEDAVLIREYLIDLLAVEGALWPVKNQILTEALDHVAIRSERGTHRPTAAIMAAAELPNDLGATLLQSEIDYIEGQMGLTHTDYEDLLYLYQSLSAFTSMRETRTERKRLWDELLKFTQYAVRIRYANEDHDELSTTRYAWRQSSAEAQNDQLRQFRKAKQGEKTELISVQTQPESLCSPDLDPKPDIEDWVRRDWW